MKIDRGLRVDTTMAQMIEKLTAPAFLADAAYKISHCNVAMQDLLGRIDVPSGDGSVLALLAPDHRETAIADLESGDPTPRRYPSADLGWEIVLLPKETGTAADAAFVGFAVARSASLDDPALPDARDPEFIELKQRWQVALEITGQGFWDHNMETGHSYRSDSWSRLRGLDPTTQRTRTIAHSIEEIHPDDIGEILKRKALVDAGHTDIVNYEYRERHQDGRWIWILSRGRVVQRNDQGAPIRIIGNDTDVTDLKIRDEAFGYRAKSLELAVRVAGIGVWEYDITTNSETWDDQMYHIYGLDPKFADPAQKIWEDTIHPDDKAAAMEMSDHCMATGEEFFLDYRVTRADGVVRNIRSHAAFHENSMGLKKLIGVNWDITADNEVAAALKAANELANDRNIALEKARVEMEHGALHDELTGLANRRKLDEFCKSVASDTTSALLHVDLDRFKQINDTIGHSAGDQALVHAANILADAAPPGALVARVGGDEFVIFIEQTPGDDLLENLATAVIARAAQPFAVKQGEVRFGMSVGIAKGRRKATIESQLFAHADLALYEAKNEGRGRFRFYTDDLKIAADEKKQCADQILTAFEKDEFFCVYQPQFDARTLSLSGVEALVRWRHPSGDIWGPDRFLPIAEELDVVGRIDRLVFQTALADMGKWRAAGLAVPRMSVNVSARRLCDPHLFEDLAILQNSPENFAFELLESVFLDTQDNELAANLDFIRDSGVEIEVDDFGTGHASIVGLLKLQPARLKIDRELVKPIDTSQQQRLLLQSIIEIGRLQGIGVVAEGVETEEHISILQSLGCDYLQGYGLARPTPAAELSALLMAAQTNDKYRPFQSAKS